MARLNTIDSTERKKYQDYNRQVYGTSLSANQNDRRSTTPTTHTTQSEPAAPHAPAPRYTRRTRRTQQGNTRHTRYRPNRRNRRIRARVTRPIKKRVSFGVRWLVRSIILFLHAPQVILGLVVLALIVGIGAIESFEAGSKALEFIRTVIEEIFGFDPMNGFAGLWILVMSFGWLKLFTAVIVLKVSGAHPLFGTQAGKKLGLFFGAMILAVIPGANIIPWGIVWAEFVIRHPK
jgi:hypothetical protein